MAMVRVSKLLGSNINPNLNSNSALTLIMTLNSHHIFRLFGLDVFRLLVCVLDIEFSRFEERVCFHSRKYSQRLHKVPGG